MQLELPTFGMLITSIYCMTILQSDNGTTNEEKQGLCWSGMLLYFKTVHDLVSVCACTLAQMLENQTW